MLECILAPLARDDLDQIHYSISVHHPNAANRFLSSAFATMEQLSRFPKLGRAWLEPRDLRSFPVKRFDSYLIFYRHTQETLQVVRVLHASRDLPKILPPNR